MREAAGGTSQDRRTGPAGGGSSDGREPASVGWRVFFGVVVLLGLGWIVAHRSEGYQFLDLVQNAEPWWLAVAALLQFLTYPVDGIVWQRVLVRLPGEKQLGFGTLTELSMAKFFVDQFVPVGGVGGTVLVMRSLEKRGVSRDGAMVGLLARLVSYYLAYGAALALAVGVIRATGHHLPRLVLLPALGFALFFLVMPGLLLRLLRQGGRGLSSHLLRLRVLRRMRPTIDSMIRVAPVVRRNRWMLLDCAAWQLAIFLLDGVTLWATLRAVGAEASLPVASAAFLLGFLAASLGVVPAGVGIFEAGAVGALSLLGVPGAAALTGTLLFRGFSLWLPLAPSAFYGRRESWR